MLLPSKGARQCLRIHGDRLNLLFGFGGTTGPGSRRLVYCISLVEHWSYFPFSSSSDLPINSPVMHNSMTLAFGKNDSNHTRSREQASFLGATSPTVHPCSAVTRWPPLGLGKPFGIRYCQGLPLQRCSVSTMGSPASDAPWPTLSGEAPSPPWHEPGMHVRDLPIIYPTVRQISSHRLVCAKDSGRLGDLITNQSLPC
ncbi:uncharacterized protein LY79DRAFT_56125 [Colletotrichum navitas]|uniref:Uncharacterized protein n=1 Tax=Colletotrichum navitas TaxID=681940 RepID=A0AAD8PMN8_9PEZI|nr:uncharacterized protein LY79DRAFT_56125 [Colletotrichum navitas]KAK1569963.1 hypothetical protein LY79DRAFT_56125 [Colletotrichum navitas]